MQWKKINTKGLNVENMVDANKFHFSLVDALVSANIPIAKLKNQKFKSFLENYTGKSIKSLTFYRNMAVESVYATS